MKIKEKLYIVTKGSSLSDYALFNMDNKHKEKNIFLSLITKALHKNEWFDVSKFRNLGEKSFLKEKTQVPFADNHVKDEEYKTLIKIFNKSEMEDITYIIENMKSYGVKAIKELMDEEENTSKISSWMRSVLF